LVGAEKEGGDVLIADGKSGSGTEKEPSPPKSARENTPEAICPEKKAVT